MSVVTVLAVATFAAPASAAPRPAARFDFTGDGRDELVIPVIAHTGGLYYVVRSLGRADQVLVPPEGSSFYLRDAVAGDFNGDGFADLATIGHRPTLVFSLMVFAGSANGLSSAPIEIPGVLAAFMATGDINNDGYADLVSTANGAGVDVFFGSPAGLAPSTVHVTQVVPGYPSLVDEFFGTDVALGDFTGDGFDDLVVLGRRRASHEHDNHGMVTMFAGPSLTSVTSIEGAIDTWESLPIDLVQLTDMNQDGRDDLILGVPRQSGGWVGYLPGSSGGLNVANLKKISQNTPGVPGEPDPDPTGGHFGYSVATGDATGDGIPDLLIGAVTMTVGTVTDAGSITLVPGTPQGPTGAGSIAYSQFTTGGFDPRSDPAGEPAEAQDYLGSAVALIDFDGAGPFEMFAEAQFEDMWQSQPGDPNGLITTLEIIGGTPRRGAQPANPARLVATKHSRPADVTQQSGLQIWRLDSGLLHL